MNKFTLILASVVLAFSATTALAMDGLADRINEARSYSNKTVVIVAKTVDTVAGVKASAQ